MIVVCGDPEESDWGDLLFAWRVCKHVTSNAIVIAKDLRTIGIGAGQMSRVDAVRLALDKAEEHGHDVGRRRARLRRVLPVPRRPDAGTRPRRDGNHPAGRIEARLGRGRRSQDGERDDGLHRPPPLQTLSVVPESADRPARACPLALAHDARSTDLRRRPRCARADRAVPARDGAQPLPRARRARRRRDLGQAREPPAGRATSRCAAASTWSRSSPTTSARRGLVTASTGNHGQSIAFAARLVRRPRGHLRSGGREPGQGRLDPRPRRRDRRARSRLRRGAGAVRDALARARIPLRPLRRTNRT